MTYYQLCLFLLGLSQIFFGSQGLVGSHGVPRIIHNTRRPNTGGRLRVRRRFDKEKLAVCEWLFTAMPRACVRVYARVLVPPNLYIRYTHTFPNQSTAAAAGAAAEQGQKPHPCCEQV